jgi:hypothetical protein
MDGPLSLFATTELPILHFRLTKNICTFFAKIFYKAGPGALRNMWELPALSGRSLVNITAL